MTQALLNSVKPSLPHKLIIRVKGARDLVVSTTQCLTTLRRRLRTWEYSYTNVISGTMLIGIHCHRSLPCLIGCSAYFELSLARTTRQRKLSLAIIQNRANCFTSVRSSGYTGSENGMRTGSYGRMRSQISSLTTYLGRSSGSGEKTTAFNFSSRSYCLQRQYTRGRRSIVSSCSLC